MRSLQYWHLIFGCWIFSIPSKSLDPDQARHFFGPDLGPNCLLRLSADIAGKEFNTKQLVDTLWLKPWLKLNSLAPTFSVWLKCLLHNTLSQGKP